MREYQVENFGPETKTPEQREQELISQFDKPEQIEMGGEMIDVVDIAPTEVKSKTPTIYFPGFSATPEALKDAILRTAEAGRRVISAYAAHGVNTSKEYANIPEAQTRKVELLLQMIENKKLEKVNIITTSEGAIIAALAANLHPEKFENIVLVEPAGMIGKDTFFELLKRVWKDLQRERAMAPSLKKVKFPSPQDVGVKSVLSDVAQSMREVDAIANSDITGALENIHNAGIGVSIIHGVDDEFFPMERVQQMTKAGMVDGFYSVKGTHNMIYSYEPYGRAAEAALSALENKKAKQK